MPFEPFSVSTTPLPTPNVDKPGDDNKHNSNPQTTVIVPQAAPTMPMFPWPLGPVPYYPQLINPGFQGPTTLPGTFVP